jgi:dihydropteroate synthase
LGLAHPVLVGASRKRFLGTVTGEPAPDRRVGSSVAAALLAVQGGASIVRVHDVGATVRALRVMKLRD